MEEVDGKSDEVASKEAWDKHILRNDSVILDLFHGQYKSTLICSICSRVSITFDPYLTLTVPIPGSKKKFPFFYIPYSMDVEDYTNFIGEVYMRESENFQAFRIEVAQKLKISPSDYIVTYAVDSQIKKMHNLQSKLEDIGSGGAIILYQINPLLNPKLPLLEQANKTDNNYGVGEEWTKQVIYIKKYQKSQYSSFNSLIFVNIPRVMWVNKNWSLKQLHFEIYKFMKKMFLMWY